MRNSFLQNLTEIRGFLAISSVIILIYGLQQAQEIIVPFILAIFLSSIVAYPLEWLISKKIPRILAIMIVIIIAVSILFGITMIFITSLNNFVLNIDNYQNNLTSFYNSSMIKLTQVVSSNSLISNNIHDLNVMDEISSSISPSTIMGFVSGFIGSVRSLLTDIFLVVLAMLFILLEFSSFKYKVSLLNKIKPDTRKFVHRFTESMRHYLGLKFLVSLATGIVITMFMYLIGLDYPFLWGIIAFLLNFIPTIGSIIASIPAIVLALIQLGYADASLVALSYLGTNLLIGNLLEPRIMGDGLGLSTLVVFVSLIFWGWIFGIAGMLLAVPLTMSVKIALESSPSTEHLGIMLSSSRELRKMKKNE